MYNGMPSRPKVMSLDPSPQVQRHRHRWAAEGAEEEAHEIRQLAPVPALGAHAVLDSQGPEVDEVPARGYAAAALPGDKHAHQAARLAVFEGPVSDLLGAGLPQRPDDLGARRPRPRRFSRERAEIREWAGDYDPARFDLATAKVTVAAI